MPIIVLQLNVVRSTIAKGDANVALGLERGTPTDADEWVTLLNKAGGAAPNGDFAYKAGEFIRASSEKGWIPVSVDDGDVLITRPCYGSFDTGLATTIETNGSVTLSAPDCSRAPPEFDVQIPAS